MASSLASQLEALAVAGSQPTIVHSKSKASLVFSPSQAADVDLRTIFDLCDSGVQELVGMDRRFEAYRKTLFSQETLKLDRELQSRELNEKLNSSISAFLRILSNYIMLKPAHYILEYLIRRYKAHIHNVDDILICALPYHDTSLFVRLVQLLQLKKTKWAFLEGVQTSGAAPTRAALVNQCRSDTAMLEALCEAAIKVARTPSKTRTVASLTSIIVMELLAAVPTVESSTISRILPFVLHSFEGGITEDYRVGALLVVATLANRSSLSISLVETFIVALAKTIQKESAVEGAPLLRISLMVMIQLVQTQSLGHFPVEAFKILVKLRVFYELLAKLTIMYDASRLISLYLQVHVEHCVVHANYEQSLVSMIDTVPLKDYVGQLVASILRLYMGSVGVEGVEPKTLKQEEVAKRLFQVLEMRFPLELDSAISSCLQSVRGSEKYVNGCPLYQAVQEIFLGTLHMPLVESNKTLYSSLHHHEARVREAAVRRLAELDEEKSNNLPSEMKDVMWEALFQCANEDDCGVLLAILSVKSLFHSPFRERVFKILTSIIINGVSSVSAGWKVNAQAIATTITALKLLASEFLHPSFSDRISSIVFGLLLASPKTLELNLAALQVAGRMCFPLFESLPEFQDSILEQQRGAKKQKSMLSLLVNEKVVSSVATCVLKKSEVLLPVLLKSTSESPRSKCLTLAILLHVLHESPEDCILNVVKVSLPWLTEQVAVLESDQGFDLKNPTIQLRDYEANKIRVIAYGMLDVRPIHVQEELLLKNFYQVVKVVPISSKGESVGSNDSLKSLYEFLASARVRDKFSPHLELLLRRLSDNVLSFLYGYLVTADVETSPHLLNRSLNLLASYYSQLATATGEDSFKLDEKVFNQLQMALPILVRGLANPVQNIRRSAAECLQQLHKLSLEHVNVPSNGAMSLRSEVLQPDTFETVLKALVEAKAACTSNEKYVAIVLGNLLNQSESETLSSSKASRLKPLACKAVVSFLIEHAMKVSAAAQRIMFSLLKSAGHEVELLGALDRNLELLLERRARHHLAISPASEIDKLSSAEVDLLDVVLQMYTAKASAAFTASCNCESRLLYHFLEALKVEGGSLSDPAVVRPCMASLGCLTSEFFKHLSADVQEEVFQALLQLSSSICVDIHAATRAVLQNITIPAEIIAAYLRRLSSETKAIEESPAKKRRRVKLVMSTEFVLWPSSPKKQLSYTATLLELLAWLPNIEDRQDLVSPLYQLLNYVRSERWLSPTFNCVIPEDREDEAVPLINFDYIQQLVFINLERLATVLLSNTSPDHAELFDVNTLVECVADTSDPTTRNQALILITTIARVFPEKVLNHIVDLFSVIGVSTITQDDKYSHDVTQQLLEAVLPIWLNTYKEPTTLLHVLVTALPQVPMHRRMSLVTTLLRVMEEKDSLHLFLMLLLGSTNGEAPEQNLEESGGLEMWKEKWEVKFARDLCLEYTPNVWLPALVNLLEATSGSTSAVACQFITYQLQGLSDNSKVHVPQEAFVALLGQVVIRLHSGRRHNQSSLVALLDCLTLVMEPFAYMEGLVELLNVSDNDIRRKVLILYSTRMKVQDDSLEHSRRSNKYKQKTADKSILTREHGLQERMVSLLSDILLAPVDDASAAVKLAAMDALEKCAAKLATTGHAGSLVNILPAAVSVLTSKRRALCVGGVRCVGTLVSILGPRALSSLPAIVTQLLIVGRDAIPMSSFVAGSTEPYANAGADIILSVVKTIGLILENLGAFLNPYLSDIISFLVLQPSVIKSPDVNVTSNAVTVLGLLADRIPARLLLDPLIGAYEQSLKVGHEATTALFDMIAAVASRMDRASVTSYCVKVFNLCLQGLDLRSSRPSSFASIELVEKSVIGALSSLVLKLSENLFKPLFVRLLDWAQTSSVEGDGLLGIQLDRRIPFFGLVHQLLEKLRSLFVPYFSFLLDFSVSALVDGPDSGVSDSMRPKKRKQKALVGGSSVFLSMTSWHLRLLVLSSLHKCFLYDTVGFLDSARFQQLLAPVVSQLVVDAPPGLSGPEGDFEYEKIPTLDEMDDAIVSCVSQMAVTSGSDFFWKPLNREVLMCTRSSRLRPRVLALRIVKQLVEQLKEEYLVLLPETLPFLAELLEDSELVVVAKSQEIIMILETTSGESLSQYF